MKNWLFEEVSKIDKSPARLRRKEKRHKLTNVRHEKEDITTKLIVFTKEIAVCYLNQ